MRSRLRSANAAELGWCEGERHTVVAIAQASRAWTVVEAMPLVPPASGAMIFRARHAGRTIDAGRDIGVDGAEEARPAGPGFELPLRPEQRQSASRAREDAAPVLVVERACVWALGPLAPQHGICVRLQALTPLCVGEAAFGRAREVASLCRGQLRAGCGKEQCAKKCGAAV